MSKKSIQKVLDTVSKYSEDYRLRIKELNNLVRDGQRTGDALKVGAAYYYISVAYNDLGDRDETLKNALKAEAEELWHSLIDENSIKASADVLKALTSVLTNFV